MSSYTIKSESPSLSDAVMIDQAGDYQQNETIDPNASQASSSEEPLLGEATFTSDPLASISPPIPFDVFDEIREKKEIARLQGMIYIPVTINTWQYIIMTYY